MVAMGVANHGQTDKHTQAHSLAFTQTHSHTFTDRTVYELLMTKASAVQV